MTLLILHVHVRSYQSRSDLIRGRCNLHDMRGSEEKKKKKYSGEYFVYKLMATLAEIIFALWHLHVWIHKGISAYLGFYTSISYCESEKPMETLYDCDTHP